MLIKFRFLSLKVKVVDILLKSLIKKVSKIIFRKKIQKMPSAEASKTFDWAGHVMSNPSAYPDVFVSIFLALDLETVTLDNCERVSGSWRDFIRGYLWQSARVLVSSR